MLRLLLNFYRTTVNNNNYLKNEVKLLQEESSHYREEYEKCNLELNTARNSFTGENVLKYHRAVSEYRVLIKRLLELWEKQEYHQIGEYLNESLDKKEI